MELHKKNLFFDCNVMPPLRLVPIISKGESLANLDNKP